MMISSEKKKYNQCYVFFFFFSREPQDMAGELDIDTTSDSDSESEWDTESSTGSDSLSEDNSAEEVKQGNKRKLTKRNCKQKETSSPSTTKKRQAEGTKVCLI